jgi:bifunctional N-acetylglucosamine-1-phosphate-uridyltransferase/glucosamine-1-phosphate-acetyltransferase GlmU-like protein
VLQHLKDSDVSQRFDITVWMTDNAEILKNVWFSDESHFYLDQKLNKQNHRHWSDVRPNIFVEKSCHAENVTVWAAINSTGIIGPFFLLRPKRKYRDNQQ